MMETIDEALTVITSLMVDDLPCYVLSGSGSGWFFSPDAQQMVCIQRGIEIMPLVDEVDSNGKMLVSSPSHVFLISQKEVLEVGYN